MVKFKDFLRPLSVFQVFFKANFILRTFQDNPVYSSIFQACAIPVQSTSVTLKIRSRFPKSNQLLPSSKKCIYASLVKVHQLVQEIMHRKEADADEIHTKNNIITKAMDSHSVL